MTMANQAIKSGNILELVALTVLLFGGWSGAFIGWLLGAGAGLMAFIREFPRRRCPFKAIPTQSRYLDLHRQLD